MGRKNKYNEPSNTANFRIPNMPKEDRTFFRETINHIIEELVKLRLNPLYNTSLEPIKLHFIEYYKLNPVKINPFSNITLKKKLNTDVLEQLKKLLQKR